MYNAFDFKDFEQRLLEALNKNEKFIKLLKEEESAADKAKKMGLTSMGFGRWGKDDKVTHQTKDGKLEPVTEKEPTDKSADDAKKSADKGKSPETNKKEKGGDTNKKPQKEKEVEPEHKRAQQTLPKARLGGRPLRKVPPEQLQQVATRIEDLVKMGQEAREKGENAPDFNLCQVSIPGTNLFCGDNHGIERDDMPQFKGMPRPGSEADKLPKDKKGQVDTEELFKKMLERDGIEVSAPQSVSADQLKATQSELVGVQVAEMSKVLEKGADDPGYQAITAPIYVSNDGYVLDGHHRWAAIVAHNASNPKNQIEMKVRVIDEGILPLVKRSNDFAKELGIEPKAGKSKNAGEKPAKTPKEEPKPAETPKEEPKPAETPKEEPTRPKFKNWPQPEKGLTRKALDAVKGWSKHFKEEAKEFFEKEGHKGGSKERRSLAKAMQDKASGAVKATKHFFKHEAAVFRDAGRGVRSLFRGKKPNERERDAMKSAGIKILVVALSTAATGGAGHGLAAFGKHLMTHFVEHVAGESILKGAGASVIAAGAEDDTDDAMMEKYAQLLIKNFEEMDIPEEIIEKAIMSFNGKGEK